MDTKVKFALSCVVALVLMLITCTGFAKPGGSHCSVCWQSEPDPVLLVDNNIGAVKPASGTEVTNGRHDNEEDWWFSGTKKLVLILLFSAWGIWSVWRKKQKAHHEATKDG